MLEEVLGVTYPVDFIEGCWRVKRGCDNTYPIKLAGSPVTSFISGWRPKFLVDFSLDVYLLEMVHDNGQEATWFLDRDYDHLTDRIKSLRAKHQDALLKKLVKSVYSGYDNALVTTEPSNGKEHHLENFVNEYTIRQLVDIIAQQTHFFCQTVNAQVFRSHSINFNSENKTLILKHLDTIFKSDLRKNIDAALVSGYLDCPSPVDGAKLRSCHSLVIHEHRMAFRFVDSIHNFVFYLSATHHPTKIADLYIPAANIAFTTLPDDARTPSAGLVAEYLTHFVARHQEIVSYLGANRHTPAVVCRGFPGMHIGHQLWNELTAYERLAKSLDRDRLPILVVPNAEHGSEAYGPMDKLFPEWTGKVDRSLRMSTETLGQYVYRKGYFLFRAIDHYVTVNLSDRLIRFALTTPMTSVARARVAELTRAGFTLVTLGLRVENRTAVNLYEVFEQTIIHMAQKIPKLAIVIDGHNGRLDGDITTAFESFGQGDLPSPILTELELATKLRRRFEFTEVKIINAIGSAVVDSIVWTEASLCFVAIWGASLAKYRWACNKVGLVISSHINITSRHDLHIYDSPEFQEHPAPILYMDSACVSDRPEAPVLFSPSVPTPPFYANFHVDCTKLIPQIDKLLEMSAARSVPQALEHTLELS